MEKKFRVYYLFTIFIIALLGSVANAQDTYEVTFTVDLSVQESAGLFDPHCHVEIISYK